MGYDTPRIVERVEASDQIAFKFQDAAKITGISIRTLHRLMANKLIRPVRDIHVIAKEELLRFLHERSNVQTKRKRIDAPKPTRTKISEIQMHRLLETGKRLAKVERDELAHNPRSHAWPQAFFPMWLEYLDGLLCAMKA
jgi:Helix-turn-helix domain